MGNDLMVLDVPELQTIELSKAKQIKAVFEPMAAMLADFEAAYIEVIQESEKEVTSEVMARAKRLRLDIGKVRIEAEKVRKAQKDEYLRAGKAIDGVSNVLKWAITDKEKKLKEIEDHFETQKKLKREALQQERAEKLILYVEDAHERNLADMDEDVWIAYLGAKKQAYDDRIAAEQKAEEERIAREKAEHEERARIRKENERLKKEAIEREKKEKAEKAKRDREEAARKDKEDKERKERERKEQEEREAHEAELRKERAEKERIEREEKAKREKLEAKIRDTEEKERKAREEAEAKKEAELRKGDEDKIADLISDLEGLKLKYSFKSKLNKVIYANAQNMLDSIIEYLGGRSH